jgi:hypothetical protein
MKIEANLRNKPKKKVDLLSLSKGLLSTVVWMQKAFSPWNAGN